MLNSCVGALRGMLVPACRFRSSAVALLAAWLIAAAVPANGADLFFSEYIEGTSNNKALEIFNGTGAPVDLAAGNYVVQMFFNGGTTAGLTIALTGTVASSGVFVLAQSSASPVILAKANQTNGAGWFNGDDAVVLRKGGASGTIVDSIGQLGVDPGTEWGTGLTSTADNTLRRKISVLQGRTNATDPFDPAVEWDGFPTDTFAGLGVHGQDEGGGGGVIGACGDTGTRIHAIQGSGAVSPMAGSTVNIEGIVVGSYQGVPGLPGFFVQEPDNRADADPATSEGIFVFDSGSPVGVQRGDFVRVRGSVSEFGNAGATLTELSNVAGVLVCATGQLASVTPTLVMLPVASVSDWERYEGMLIRISQALTVTGNFNLGAFGEVDVATGRLFSPTQVAAPGAAAIARQDLNDRSRIVLDDGSSLSRQNFDPPARLFPEGGGLSASNTLRVGDGVTDVSGGQGITGVLDQRFGAYRIHPVNQPVFFHTPSGANPRPAAPEAVGGTLRVASFNVLNYFSTLDTGAPVCGPSLNIDCRGANTAAEFTRQRDKIISAIRALNAHVVGLIELENNPVQSLADLVDGLNSPPGAPGTWAFVNTGTIGTDAIKVGFIYQTAAVAPLGSHAVLTSAVDPRVIDTKSRPPLAQTFQQSSTGQRLTVVINHFKSKGSDCNTASAPGELTDPDTGDGQGNCNLTRISIAQALIDWLAGNPTGSGDRDVLIIGDLNAYALEDPMRALTDPSFDPPDPVNPGHPGFAPNAKAIYTNLATKFLGLETYSFQFQGQSGSLDHALASRSLMPLVTGVSHWHINADEPVALDYNEEWTATIDKNANQLGSLYASTPFKSSDHDPLVVGLNLVCGDLNDDSVVNAADLAIFRAALGSKQGDANYNRRADYDLDGQVTLRDYQGWVACSRGQPLPPL